ncbi:MAG: UvrD-helicase domain-containing protein [Solirubrobacterales bacterium]|nr:UvrD-helicase domain-containing protein [Solirubrobacterales bacterium]
MSASGDHFEPTEQQKEVIESTESGILVGAGAGSGKTSTTVDRYISLLDRDPPLEPRQILAFTFTDKAAGELREKVRKARKERAERAGDPNPDAVSMSDAWVGTFHAICNRILKAWPIEAGIDPGFTVLDATSGETLRKESFDRALRKFCSADESRYETVGLFREAPLRNCIQYAYDELRSRGIEDPRLPDFADTPFPTEQVTRLKEMVDDAVDGDLTETRRKKLEELGGILDREAFDELRLDGKLALRAGKNEVLIALEDGYAGLCDALIRRAADPVRRQLDELLELYGNEYAETKAGRSALDYEDLQLRALSLLRNHDSIRGAYQERFREVMVDEFQDTNLLQLDLVRELAGKATLITVGDEMQSIYGFRHADVQLFRDRREQEGVRSYGLTENFRSRPLVVAAVNAIGAELEQQAPGRTDSVPHHEFRELMVASGADQSAPASVSILLTGRNGWKPEDLGELAPPGNPEVGKEQDHYNEAEALAVARHLRGLVDEEENGISQGDIAILLRAKTRTHLYVEALRQFGLTPYVVAGRGFWTTREAVELRALLAVIANPLDDNNLLGALTSPACGLSSDALWLLRRATPWNRPFWPTLASVARSTALPGHGYETADDAAEWLEQIPDQDIAKAATFVEQTDSLRRRATIVPLDELIDEAATVTGYDLANLIRDPSGNGLATVRRAASLAREYEAAEGRTLRGFLDWASLSEQLDSEAAAATADEASDVVRIMTIHAAKGLEFKVACVPDLGRELQSRHDHALRLGRSEDPARPEEFAIGLDLPRFDSKSLPAYQSNALKETARITNQDEELRLLHVAMTRAEEHLVLSGVLPEKWPGGGISPATPMITRISEAFGFDPETPDSWGPAIPVDGGEIAIVKNLAGGDRAEELRARPAPVSSPSVSEPAGAQPPIVDKGFRVYPDVPLSFSALAEFAECPTRFYARRVLRLSEHGVAGGPENPDEESLSGRSRATRLGTAVHNVLEALAKAGWPTTGRDDLETSLRREGLGRRGAGDANGADELDDARQMVEGFFASEIGETIRAAESGAEVPLLLSHRDVTIRGSADLIVEGDPPLIVDYKTNRLDGEAPRDRMEPYELQRGLYALALARARGIDLVETAYVFLRQPAEPVFRTLGPDDFRQTEEDLDETLTEIISGRFFGGEAARHDPCRSCWACDLLGAQIERTAERQA